MSLKIIYHASTDKKRKVKECIRNGVCFDAMNYKQETALLFAAKNGCLSTLKYLLKIGADPNKMSIGGLTPTLAAAFNGHDKCLAKLLKAGGVWRPTILESTWLQDTQPLESSNQENFEISPRIIHVDHSSRSIDVCGIFTLRNGRVGARSCLARIQSTQNTDGDNNNDGIRLLRKEVETLRVLRHPNILKVYYMSRSDDFKFLVLISEPIEHGNLFHVLHDLKKKFTITEGKDILKQILHAMIFLQSKDIIHNFLNSSSIYFARDWLVKVGNFQYCIYGSKLDDINFLIHNTAEEYHLPYTSSEIIKDGDFSELSDVYSFGCIAWEIFSRKRPWSWLTKNDLISMAQVLHNVRLPLQSNWPIFLTTVIKLCAEQVKSARTTFGQIYDMIFNDTLEDQDVTNINESGPKECPTTKSINNASGIAVTSSRSAVTPMSTRTPHVTFNAVETTSPPLPPPTQQSKSKLSIPPQNSSSVFPKKSCLKNSLDSSLFMKTMLHDFSFQSQRNYPYSGNQMLDSFTRSKENPQREKKKKYRNSVERVVDIHIPYSDDEECTEVDNNCLAGGKFSKSERKKSWTSQIETLNNIETIMTDTESLINGDNDRIHPLYMTIPQLPSQSVSAHGYSKQILKDQKMKNAMIRDIFKIASRHQKKNWARTSMLDRDFLGHRCYKSRSWCKVPTNKC